MIGFAMLTIAFSWSSVFGMHFWLRFNNPHKVILGMSYWPGRYYYYTFFPVWIMYFIVNGFRFGWFHLGAYLSAIVLLWSYFSWKKKNPNEPLQEQARLIPDTRIRFALLPNMVIFMLFIPCDIMLKYGLM